MFPLLLCEPVFSLWRRPLPAADLKPSTVNSTSDSDLMKLRTVSRIPQVRLSFGADPRTRSPSAGEIEIITASRVKERTQHVTERVTQVTQVRSGRSQLLYFLLQFSLVPVGVKTQNGYNWLARSCVREGERERLLSGSDAAPDLDLCS